MAPRTILVCASEWNGLLNLATSFANKLAVRHDLRKDEDKNAWLKDDECVLEIVDFADIENWLYESVSQPRACNILLLISTSSNGNVAPHCQKSLEELRAFCHDHRADPSERRKITYNVIGYGDTAFGGENFCRPAIEINKLLKLGGCLRKDRLCNVDASGTVNREIDVKRKYDWIDSCVIAANEVDQKLNDTTTEESDNDSAVESFDEFSDSFSKSMITESQKAVLVKQGYKVIGTHSAVKMCRWTKHQLRAQGGCYKHTFYGIQSHRCMEATCCLACANKCVFCWRHHKNPVAKEWRWEMDDPKQIVEEAINQQKEMVKMFKGAKGVVETGRLDEGLAVAHCALSLVGEPILYPRISELLQELHSRNISTFLVNNGQFPEQILNLTPCTQLYVSVDAANPSTMRELDRPLHEDFWDRFLRSLSYLKNRPERTVYRLTLVKEKNELDVNGYANLIPLGEPDFVELKGVTFTGKGCGIRMTNVPTHEEVLEFAVELIGELKNRSYDYDIAVEHEHSCSVLLAKKKYFINGQWHTWIDYPKFFEWAKKVVEADRTEWFEFDNLDYATATPSWALYGSEEKGFDPADRRKYTKNRLLMLQSAGRLPAPASCESCNC